MTSSTLLHLRPEVAELKKRLDAFVEQECIPCELEFNAHLKDRHGNDRWTDDAIPPCMDRLKARAKQLGLWNLFIPPHLISKLPVDDPTLAPSLVLTYREYGILCESLGRSTLAPEACNTSAPDTGNMEVLLEFGTQDQQHQYLLPLLKGDIRSAFLMTEPDVASSDPTNLQTKLEKRILANGDVEYILSGSKWWSTGAMHPRCRVALVVARMDYSHPSCQAQHHHQPTVQRRTVLASHHGAHTIVLVPMPHSQVVLQRPLTVMGYDDAPQGHAQVLLNQIHLTPHDLILGEGSGFRVAQARLGPGRIHHCMRAIGMASRCYELMLQRILKRKTFGKYLWEHGVCQEMVADSMIDLEAARLLTLSCAAHMDVMGAQSAREYIAAVKVAIPQLTYQVVDRAVQLFGGAGLGDDEILAKALAALRSLRIADGPDAVHKRTIALIEMKKAKKKFQSGQQRSRL